MHFIYITRVRLPSRAAQSLQILAMARAFHECLGGAFRLISCKGEPDGTPSPAFQWEVRSYGQSQWLRYGALFLETFLRALTDRGTIIFTRDIALAMAAVLAGGKAVYEAHKPPIGKTASWMVILLAKSNRFKLVAISEALADFYRTIYKIPEGRVLAAHDGVFPDNYRTLRSISKADIRQELHLPLDKLLVVHTGSLYKGGGELFEQVARAGGGDVVFLHIGGSEADRQRWTEHYQRLRLYNVVFLPHVQAEQVRLYQMAADLLFFVTTRESPIYWCTSPLKLFEYMATGIPILGACIGSVSEVLNDGNSYCFDPDKPESISEAFRRFCLDGTLAQRKAEEALRVVERNFSWYERARKIVNFATAERTG